MNRYGRKVGKVLLGGQDANLRQIQRGLAWLGITKLMSANNRKSTARSILKLKVKLGPPNEGCGLMLRQSLLGNLGAISNTCAMNFAWYKT